MKGKNKILVMLALGGVVFCLIPIAVALGITKPILFWKNFSGKNEWIGFWGGYIGAIITSCVAWGTWYFQRKEDRKKEVLPVINVCQINGNRPLRETDFSLDYYADLEGKFVIGVLDDPQNDKIRSDFLNKSRYFRTDILVENIGKGAVMNLRIDIEGKEKMGARRNAAISLGEKGSAKYTIYIDADKLLEAVQTNKMIFRFSDVYDNKYQQIVKFGIIDKNKMQQDNLNNEKIQSEWRLTYLNPISALEEDT